MKVNKITNNTSTIGVPEWDNSVIYVSASPFSGKTKVFSMLEYNKLKRPYSDIRIYQGFYLIQGTLVVDLDEECFHIYELMKLPDLKMFFNVLLHNINRSEKYNIERCILVGHFREDADFQAIAREIPNNDGRNQEEHYKLRKQVYATHLEGFHRVNQNYKLCPESLKMGIVLKILDEQARIFARLDKSDAID